MHQHRNKGPASLQTFHTLLQYGHAPQISASSSRPTNTSKNNSFKFKSVAAIKAVWTFQFRQFRTKKNIFRLPTSVINIKLSVARPPGLTKVELQFQTMLFQRNLCVCLSCYDLHLESSKLTWNNPLLCNHCLDTGPLVQANLTN